MPAVCLLCKVTSLYLLVKSLFDERLYFFEEFVV
jgi:hypothetical protein